MSGVATANREFNVDAAFEEYRRTKSRRLRNRLVEAHIHLVEHHVGRYKRPAVPVEDVRQQALLALIGAVERFDPEVGVAFATFASRTIDGELKRLARDRAWSVRPPRSLQELHLEVRRAQEDLEQTLKRTPTVSDLAEHLGEHPDRVLEAIGAGGAYRAKNIEPSGEMSDDEGGGGVVVSDHDRGFGHVERQMLVERLLDQLDERDQAIVRMRFFDGMTQPEIAEVVGVSQSYLSRVLRRVLGELRDRMEEQEGIDAESGAT